MKIAVSIPDSLFQNAERLTKRLGVSRSELYQRALAQFLERHQNHSVTAALNAVYEDDPAASRLDPVLAALQNATLPRDFRQFAA